MPDTKSARDLIRRYVRLLGDWATPPELTERRTEEVYQAVRAEVLAEAADAIDEVADAAEEDAIASDGYAYGRSNPTVAVHREDAALLRRLAAAPTTPTTKEK